MSLYKFNRAGPTREEYDIILDNAKNKTTVLEFGPGSSTFAFVEAQVQQIYSCEHDDRWMQRAKEMFSEYPQIKLLSFDHRQFPLIIEEVESKWFDLILVDAPVGLHGKSTPRFARHENCSRWNTLKWAITHSDCVLLHDAKREGEKESLKKITELFNHNVEVFDTEKGIAKIHVKRCLY